MREAKCYAADRDLLLGAIESGYSTLDRFNDEMRKVLVAALNTSYFRNWAQSPAPSSSKGKGKTAKLRWQGVMQMAWRDLEIAGRSGETTQVEDTAGSGPMVATVTTQALAPFGAPPLPMNDASATDYDGSATDDFTAPEFETRDNAIPRLMERTPPWREPECAATLAYGTRG